MQGALVLVGPRTCYYSALCLPLVVIRRRDLGAVPYLLEEMQRWRIILSPVGHVIVRLKLDFPRPCDIYWTVPQGY